jgi:hypothetical protein
MAISEIEFSSLKTFWGNLVRIVPFLNRLDGNFHRVAGILGRIGCYRGQKPHFVGHNGEPGSGFSCLRRVNGGPTGRSPQPRAHKKKHGEEDRKFAPSLMPNSCSTLDINTLQFLLSQPFHEGGSQFVDLD